MRRLGVVLVVLALAGCASSGPSANDKDFARSLGFAGVTASESMAPINSCANPACLRRTGRAAAKRLTAQIETLRRDLVQVDDDCLAGGGRAFLPALRAYRMAAQVAALGRRARFVAAETRADGLARKAIDRVVACTPTSARTFAVLHADTAIEDAIKRIDACSDAACLHGEGTKLETIVDERRRELDDAFAHEKNACVRRTRRSFDAGLDAAKRMAQAVERLDEQAAAAAAAESARQFNAGNRATGACIH